MAAQTIYTLAAGVAQTIAAERPHRRYLQWMNVGAAPCTVSMNAGAAVAGQGMNYDPGSSSINQGGAQSFDGSFLAAASFSAISTAGTTLVVWED